MGAPAVDDAVLHRGTVSVVFAAVASVDARELFGTIRVRWAHVGAASSSECDASATCSRHAISIGTAACCHASAHCAEAGGQAKLALVTIIVSVARFAQAPIEGGEAPQTALPSDAQGGEAHGGLNAGPMPSSPRGSADSGAQHAAGAAAHHSRPLSQEQ